MDETIGAKGGYNDRRRMLKISREQKKKLIARQQEKELRDLEKKVRKQQTVTLIKTLPIAIGGGTIKTLYDIGTGKKDIDKQEEYSKWRIKEYDADMSTKSRQEKDREKQKTKQITIINPDGRKIIIEVPIETNKKVLDIPVDEDVIIVEKKKEEKEEKKSEDKKIEEKNINIEEIKEEKKSKKKSKGSSEEISMTLEEESKEEIFEKDDINISDDKKDISEISFDDLDDSLRERLYQLKSRKIIDEYEKQLKDIRYDLRGLISDYNVLVDDKNNAMTSKELEKILDRLNDVIVRVEKLKERIQIDNLDKYDDNYIYTLIEDYLLEFRDGKAVSEIKDSPLYILIAEKLDELDHRKDSLKKEVVYKKDELAIKEEDFEKLKEKYYRVDKINKDLAELQKEQEILLKEVQEKVKNAVTESERVQVELEAMNRQSRRLLRRLTFAMLFPGSRMAKGMAISTASYIHFARQLLNPTTTTKKYKVIEVNDYSRDIENSIKTIDEANSLLYKTDQQIDTLISQVKYEFQDYIGVFGECDQLLNNLYRIKNDLREKEYEMEKIKKAQERELEKNNAKVLTRGEYPM